MWYLKFNNGLRNIVQPMFIERFHTMNAGTYTTKDNKHVFQSYLTPIAYWVDANSVTTGFDDGEKLLVVDYMFDCSPTTSRQFSRWLRENGLPSFGSLKKRLPKMALGEIDFIDGCCVQYVGMATMRKNVSF